MSGFDFTFDCPVYVLGSADRGCLLTDDRCLCLWTDADAASTFVAHNSKTTPHLRDVSLVEIETDNDLLTLLMNAQEAGTVEVAVDVTNAFQRTVRMLYVADLIDMLQKRIAEKD